MNKFPHFMVWVGLIIGPLANAARPFKELPPGQQLAGLGSLVLIGVVVGIGIITLLTFTALLRPDQTRAGADRLRQHPVRSLLIGLVGSVMFLLSVSIADRLPEPVKGILFLAVLGGGLTIVVSGLAMVAHELGDRFLASIGSRVQGSAPCAVGLGGLVLVGIGFLPILGQIVQSIVLTIAIGASVNALKK